MAPAPVVWERIEARLAQEAREAEGASPSRWRTFAGGLALAAGVAAVALLFGHNAGQESQRALAATALAALAEAAATVAPSGKQNSFAAHGRAEYILAEKGDQQPRTLAGAFSRPVSGDDLMAASCRALAGFRADLQTAYGPAAEAQVEMRVGAQGSLADIVAFARA